MSTSIERAGLLCAVFALGGVGLWTQCSPPPSGREAPTRRDSSATAPGWSRASVAPREHPDAGASLDDGGLPALEEAPWRATRCWSARVVDEHARPVAALVLAAEVEGPWIEPPPFRAEARAPEDGVVEVCSPSDAVVALDAWTDDGRWGHTSVRVSPADDDPELLEPRGMVQIAVFEPAMVVGRVVDEAGAPLAGVPLHVARYDGYDMYPPAHGRGDANESLTGRARWSSAADGSFELPIGTLSLLVVWADDGARLPAVAQPIAPRPGVVTEIELRMRRGGRFFGAVVHDGVPIEGAIVRVDDGQRFITQGTEGGTFDIPGLEPGAAVRVTAYADGYVWRTWLELPLGEHQLELELGTQLEIAFDLPAALRDCGDPPRHYGETETFGLLEAELVTADGDSITGGSLDPDRPVVLSSIPAGPALLVASAFGVETEMDVVVQAGGGSQRVLVPVHVPRDRGVVRARIDRGAAGELSGGLSLGFDLGPDDFRRVHLGTMTRTCAVVTAGTHRFDARLHPDFAATADVTVTAGSVTEQILTLAPAPSQPGRVIHLDEIFVEDGPPSCSPPVSLAYLEGRVVVASVRPGSQGLLPGDVVLAVDGTEGPYRIESALWGPPSTTASIDVLRPDGSRAWVSLPRTDCE